MAPLFRVLLKTSAFLGLFMYFLRIRVCLDFEDPSFTLFLEVQFSGCIFLSFSVSATASLKNL